MFDDIVYLSSLFHRLDKYIWQCGCFSRISGMEVFPVATV